MISCKDFSIHVNDLGMVVMTENRTGDQLRAYRQEDDIYIDSNTTSNLDSGKDRNHLLEESDWCVKLPAIQAVTALRELADTIERELLKE